MSLAAPQVVVRHRRRSEAARLGHGVRTTPELHGRSIRHPQRLSLTAYDAACEPLNKRIAKLGAEVEALREAGGGTAARQATLEEITSEWDGGDVDTRRALIRRIAPRGLVLLVPPDGRAPHTIPAKDRIAVI